MTARKRPEYKPAALPLLLSSPADAARCYMDPDVLPADITKMAMRYLETCTKCRKYYAWNNYRTRRPQLCGDCHSPKGDVIRCQGCFV